MPTLVANRATFLMYDTLATSDPRRRYEPKPILSGWDSARAGELGKIPAAVARMLEQVYASRKRLTGQLARAGVSILAGTDVADRYGVFPGFGLHEELVLLVSAGMTPLQALQSATINPARYLRATDSLGAVGRGKIADLVLLDADPLLDIRNTATIRAVFANGRHLDRKTLDEQLRIAERAATTSR